MEYATKISGAKLIVVKGHSSCGAIQGAIADAKLGNRLSCAKIRPAIAATEYPGTRTAVTRFIVTVARKSVELTVDRIRPAVRSSPNEGSGPSRSSDCFQLIHRCRRFPDRGRSPLQA
jgi:carbonic anhydrase